MEISKTEDSAYADRLVNIQIKWWKKAIRKVDPYQWNLLRLNPGFTLDIGCGLGRNLRHIKGNGVGLDHNAKCVEYCISQGYKAFLPEEFRKSPHFEKGAFDSILLSHVAEHMAMGEVVDLIRDYRHCLKKGGKLILITPQEVGQKSDPTHVEFMDFDKLRAIARNLNVEELKSYSFPFARFVGRLFIYNEFIFVGVDKQQS